MKKIIFLCALIAFALDMQGQTMNILLDNPYEINNYARPYGCTIINDTIYITLILGNEVADQRAALYKVNMTGEILQHKTFQDSSEYSTIWNSIYSGFNQLNNVEDSVFYMAYNQYFENPIIRKNSLLKLNHNLDTLEQIEFTGINNDDKMLLNGVLKEDSTFYIYGSRCIANSYFNYPGAYNSIVIKCHLDGTEIWKQVYEDSFQVNSICPTSDGGAIVNCSEPGYQDSANLKYLIKIDAMGNEIWRREYGGVYTSSLAWVSEIEPNWYFVANNWNVSSGTISQYYNKRFQFSIIEDQGDGLNIEEVKYGFSYNYGEIFGMQELPNDEYLCWGEYGTNEGCEYMSEAWGNLPDRPYVRGYLFKVNQALDSLWLRTYYFPDNDDSLEFYSNFYITDVAPLESGGFVTCGWGQIHDENDLEKVWLMRLEQYGCLEPGCQNINVSEIVLGFENSMSVFPNPVKDRCTIEWSVDKISTIEKNFSQSELIITDTQGREIERLPISNFGTNYQIQIDMSGCASGVYQVHWVSGGSWLDTVQVVVNN